MSKAIEKYISIEVQYIDKKELKGILRTIEIQLKNGKNFNREKYGTSFYQFRKTLIELPDYKEEKINGVWCQVYQSRINKI